MRDMDRIASMVVALLTLLITLSLLAVLEDVGEYGGYCIGSVVFAGLFGTYFWISRRLRNKSRE